MAVLELKIDAEFKALIPPLSAEELSQLETNIKADGCRESIVVWNGTIIDGHNRYEICTRNGISFNTYEMILPDRDAAKVWIIRNQFGRRNISAYTRSVLALELQGLIAAKAQENIKTPTGGRAKMTLQNSGRSKVDTDKEISKLARVSHDTIAKVKVIQAKAPETLKQDLRDQKISINAAYSKVRTQENRQQRQSEIIESAKESAPLNAGLGKFPLIYADPPWRYEHVETENRAIENQYPTMELEDICALPVRDIALNDCVLFLWATSPKLAEAMRVIESWGFNYRTSMVWVKDKIGMGYYARQRHELLLIATRGNPVTPLPEHRPDSVVSAPRGKHSAKPEVFYELIERMYLELPKIELFCRTPRDGWKTWGNQVA